MSSYRDDDPPDEPEPSECCGEIMTVDGNLLVCEVCRRREEIVYEDWDPGPEPEEIDFDIERPARCPHGKEWGQCDACDFLGDIAYDAAREGRR